MGTTTATDLHYLELTDLAERIRMREISPLAVTRAQLDRIACLDGTLGSYALVMADVAMKQAKAAEAEIAAGRYRGPLHGVPIAVKDLCWIKGCPTAAGMAIYKDYRPDEDATVVLRLKEAGAILLGKLQLTEGAYLDHHPSVVPPKNPWNSEYWPGISSSGSGVATAAGLCYGSLGSDTGGSIRWPAAANGLTGLKPTWGRVSRYGVFKLAATLDHIGPMTRSAADAGALLSVIAGSDPNDRTTVPDTVPDYLTAMRQGVRDLRIGIDVAWNSHGVAASTQGVLSEATKVFRTLGANIVDVRFPDVTQAVTDWSPICAVEAAVEHEKTYPSRKDEYGSVLASLMEDGRALSSFDYEKILRRRQDLCGQIAAVFRTIDLLLIPVHPFPPLTLAMIQTLGKQPDLTSKLQRYISAFNMTGNPTITMPGGFTEAGLPIAFQLVAAHLAEATLVRAGAAFQSVTHWHRRHPPEPVPVTDPSR
jgi:amidase